MADTAEVQVKLTLDDAASKVADTIKGKFGQLGKAADKIKSEFMSVAKGALTTAIGVNLAPGLQGIVGAFKGMVDNAASVQERMRAIASYFVTGADMAWDAAMDRATRIDRELYKASIAIGQNIDDARRAFQNLATQSDGTVEGIEAAAKTTEKLLMFADITGESVTAISDEWAMMERGMVRTRGKMFKMLFSTGIFGKNLREASSYWGKLTDEQRSAAMAKAMGTIYERFAKAPQTFASVQTSLDMVKQRLLDVVGMNVIGVLTAKFDNLLQAIEGKRPQLEAIAARFGKFLGAQIEGALNWAGEKLTWLEDHWDDVVKGAEEGAKAILKAVKFIVENKELILMAYGLNVMAPSIQLGIQAAGALKPMLIGLKALSFTSLPAFTTSVTAAAGSAATLALQFAAVAAAALAIYAAFDQYKKLQSEGGFRQAWQEARYGPGMHYSEADIEATRKSIQEQQTAGGVESAAAIIQQKQESLAAMKAKAQAKFGASAPEHYEAMGITAMENMLAKFEKTMPTAANVAFAATVQTQSELIAAYNQAVKTGDDAMANYLANLAGKSESLAYGLNDSSVQIEGGFDGFINRLGTTTRTFVEKLNNMYSEQHPQNVKPKEAATKSPAIHMSGGQTFNIKQEFREADPDRIALFFRRDLVRAATSRTRSRVRTPFGA